ncbi:hypothetical protein [Thermomicrobium sp.]
MTRRTLFGRGNAREVVYEELPQLTMARKRLNEIVAELRAADERKNGLLRRIQELREREIELEVAALVGEDIGDELARVRRELAATEDEYESLPRRLERLERTRRDLEEKIRKELEPENYRHYLRAVRPTYLAYAKAFAEKLREAAEAHEAFYTFYKSLPYGVPPEWPSLWRAEFVTERGQGYLNRSRFDLWMEELVEFEKQAR